MKRTAKVTILLAAGLLLAASLATAEDTKGASPDPKVTSDGSTGGDSNAATTTTTTESMGKARRNGGEVTVGALGAEDVGSSKFREYRALPEGLSGTSVHLFSKGDRLDFNLRGDNVQQTDQRYHGWLKTDAFDLAFDYNQIPHNMGNDGRTLFTELSRGVWHMSEAQQLALGTAVVATPSAGRTTAFYDSLLGQAFGSTGTVDLSGVRKRGTATLSFGKKLPFDLTFTYMRELKSGYRGQGGGGVYSVVNSVLDVPDPLDEITQDIGVRAAYNFEKGNLHAGFVRNLYNNRAETLVVDNAFQWVDAPYTTTAGGGSRARWINAPDNEASTGNVGFLLKLARQTRIGGDLSLARWTQDAPFYPYTINTAILTPSGLRASDVSSLPQPSLGGKIDTTTMNLTFSSRPVKNLGLRAQFRRYDLANKTNRFVITGDVAASPDRSWSVVTPTAADPYGHATANVYDSTTTRFTGAVTYDIGDLTLEGQARTAKLERTSREATSGKDNAFGVSAVYHLRDWLGLRGRYDQAKRTAEGETLYGFQSDEAERETKRTGIEVEITPVSSVSFGLGYDRRDVTFPNRPDRIAVSQGSPLAGAQPIPGTPSGLLSAKYDAFTAEVGYTPSARIELAGYYTHEKDATTNQWATTTGVNLNNLLNYAGTDKADTFGLNGAFQLKPEVWTLSLNAQRQKVDGLMDITAREAGSFYTPGRTTLIPPGAGGAADIPAWDDTTLTTVGAQLDYVVAKAWTVSGGYLYEKYEFDDAFTAGNQLMPQSVLLFMKADRGAYKASVVYARIRYNF